MIARISYIVCAFLVRLTCGTRPFKPLHALRLTVPQLRSNEYRRMHTGYMCVPTGCPRHENRANRILTHKKRSSTENLNPVASVRSFEHVQNLPTDTCKTEQKGHYLTLPDTTERIHRMRN